MKIILLRLLSATFLLLGINACVGPVGPGYYGGGGYGQPVYDGGGGGYGQAPYEEDVAYYDTYGHYSAVYLPGYTRYYGHYDRYGHRDPHGIYDRHGRDYRSRTQVAHHDDHRSTNSYNNSSHTPPRQLYTHTNAGNNRGAPQGEHTESWFKQHGYSTARLAPANAAHPAPRTASKKKDDDDDKHHHH